MSLLAGGRGEGDREPYENAHRSTLYAARPKQDPPNVGERGETERRRGSLHDPQRPGLGASRRVDNAFDDYLSTDPCLPRRLGVDGRRSCDHGRPLIELRDDQRRRVEGWNG